MDNSNANINQNAVNQSNEPNRLATSNRKSYQLSKHVKERGDNDKKDKIIKDIQHKIKLASKV